MTPQQVHDDLANEIALKRLVTPEDIAGAILFLASAARATASPASRSTSTPGTTCRVKFWNALTWMEPREAIEMAVVSEECGYDGVCVADHLFSPRELKSKYPYSADGTPRFKPDDPWPDPWVTIGAMAARHRAHPLHDEHLHRAGA